MPQRTCNAPTARTGSPRVAFLVRAVDKHPVERGGRATETRPRADRDRPGSCSKAGMDIVIIVLAALRLITGRRARS